MTTTEETERTAATAGRSAARVAASLVAASAAGVAFAVLLLVVWAGWPPVREADRAVSAALNGPVADSPALAAVLRGITRLGDTETLTAAVALAAAWLVLRRRRWVAVHVVVTAAGGGLLGVVVKELVERVRPLVDVQVATAAGWSFPSGHTLGATVTWGVLLLVFGSVRRARVVLTPLVIAVVLAVGCTRVALGVHHATDVLGGWLLGLLWLALTTEVFRRWRRERGMPDVPVSHGLVPEAADDLRPSEAADDLRPSETADDLRPSSGRRPHALDDAWHVAARLLVAWGLLLGVLFCAGSVLTAAGPDVPPGWDRAVVEWAAERRTPAWDAAAERLGAVSGTGPVIGAAVVVCVLALAATRSWRPVLFVVLALLGEVTLFLVTTSVVDRARPAARLPGDLPPTSAFPSGHVAASLALATAVTVLVLRGTRAWWRWPVVAVALAVPLLVAAQRLYSGVHHPTDVLGSVLLALSWTAVVAATVLPPRSG